MTMVSGVALALAYSGIGSAIGAIVAAVISSRSEKGKFRAEAADLLTQNYGEFTDRISEDNQHMADQLVKLRKIVLGLTDLIDILMPYVKTAPAEVIKQVNDANDAAKISI